MSADLFKRTGSEDFSKYLKVMVSGPPKSGKTTLLGTVPNILVLDTEPHANNLESIAHLDVPYVTITNSDDLRQVAMILGNDSLRKQMAQGTYGIPDIGGVAIDTLDSLQKILKAERMKEQRSSQFLRDDWGWLKTEMEEIVQLFTSLPMHVFFIVHTKTAEIGRGDDAYTVVLPGLEGAIAQSIAGMVGYSLLSFRKEEVAPDGTVYTKYWLKTEGDRTHDFLGTRTAGRLPTIIEPNMKTIYDTVMANRPKKPAPAAPIPDASVQTEAVAQSAGRTEDVQTDVQTNEEANLPTSSPVETPAEPVSSPAPVAQEAPAAERPDDNEPVTPAAMGHVKRVYDALETAFPEDIVSQMTMGDARNVVKYWRAIQKDAAEGKGKPGTSPQSEMLELLSAYGYLPAEGAEEAPAAPAGPEPKVDGTIDEVLAYVSGEGGEVSLERVQEAYDLESEKGDGARATLIKKLESLGAKPVQAAPEPTPEAVTQPAEATDTPPTEEEAVKAVEEVLGATVIAEEVNPDAKCQVCGGALDDLDLAELGKKRFGKLLCVTDYLAELKN